MITTTSLNPPPPKPYDATSEPQKLFALDQRLRTALGMVASESELWRLLTESLALCTAIAHEQQTTDPNKLNQLKAVVDGGIAAFKNKHAPTKVI